MVKYIYYLYVDGMKLESSFNTDRRKLNKIKKVNEESARLMGRKHKFTIKKELFAKQRKAIRQSFGG
jgi:hypothetical protein